MTVENERLKDLRKQGYRLVGKHSAVKVCLWCKKAIRGEDVCYKNTFYGIDSWRCIQASVSVDKCNLRCQWCWRDINTNYAGELDDEPREILDGLIREQIKALEGFKGNENIDKKRFREAQEPKHIALSLSGDACLYLRLPELVNEINKRGMTSFVVTNGCFPEMLKKIKPTQLYITLPAPNFKIFERVCRGSKKDWDNIMESLNLLKEHKRGTVRLTLAKGMNMLNPEDYAKILKNVGFKFLEIKAAMPVGYARYRMEYEQMPLHSDIMEFAEKIARLNSLKIIDEKKNSRVVLVMHEDFPERRLKFQ